MSQNEEACSAANTDPDALSPEEAGIFYSRWFDVSLDIDRQLLTLSLACFGVLGTVLAGNVLKAKLHFWLWGISAFAFLLEIGLVLVVVFLNKKLLTKSLETMKYQKMPSLDFFEKASRWVFGAALLCTSAFLGAVAFSRFEEIPKTLSTEVNNERQQQAGTGLRGTFRNAEARCPADKWAFWDASDKCALTSFTASTTSSTEPANSK